MKEEEILKMVIDLEDRKEYNKAIGCLEDILENSPNSYHALFLKFRINKRMGFKDEDSLHKAFREAKLQEASPEVLELIQKELNEINTFSNKNSDRINNIILDKIRKVEALIEGAKSDGERDAAINAKRRLEEKRYKEKVEDVIEYRISTEDMWHKRLFMALCRKHSYRPYRYHRQKRTTVMVRISKHYLDNVLWQEYLEYSEQLSSLIEDITSEIISKIHKYEEEIVIMGELAQGNI